MSFVYCNDIEVLCQCKKKKPRIANLLQGNKEIESHRKIEHLVFTNTGKTKKTIFDQCFYRIIN